MLPRFDLSTDLGRQGYDQCLARLRATASSSSDAAATVERVVADVANEGDAALVRYMQKWTDPQFTADRIRVQPTELASAVRELDPELREAIASAIKQVREYQEHILPRDPKPIELGGAELGLRFTPVDSVGLCVPGGTAVLFSTLIMLAVPAQVAGVAPDRIAVMSPPPTRTGDQAVGDISPIVLATAHLLGITRVYRIGGAQGVAALAHGTASVEPVDMIAGPGNVFVQLAKAQVAGVTGTDGGFYGPSEIVTIADASANPARVAADLIAQAEHDPGKCFLVAWSPAVLDDVQSQIEKQLRERKRVAAIEKALTQDSCAVLVADASQAVAVANEIACEHLNLAVADPDAMLKEVRHAGEVFLGDTTPVAAGDYYAGPSHCLPTGTTARFTSGISCYTFLKRTGTVAYRQGMPKRAIDHVARMADAEGLDAHAASARLRGE
ncbi:histidinol dehydrogenase [Phycisphaerales bacterium AB-hyl4]|uniref:Histidinol dehydrogenase n=1 Tax=Natronomicrosphaera hydrolytica TaxID=3242702 RepID=A0ABV4U1N6_9BACT